MESKQKLNVTNNKNFEYKRTFTCAARPETFQRQPIEFIRHQTITADHFSLFFCNVVNRVDILGD